MPEYIDKSKVLEVLTSEYLTALSMDDRQTAHILGMVTDQIDKFVEPADVVLVKYGRWIDYSTGSGISTAWHRKCSVCNKEISVHGDDFGYLFPAYCPACGAVMNTDKGKDKPEPKETYPGENEVAKLVRCKDCMYGEKDRFNRILCHWFGDDESMPAVGYEDFCSQGRRKDDGE